MPEIFTQNNIYIAIGIVLIAVAVIFFSEWIKEGGKASARKIFKTQTRYEDTPMTHGECRMKAEACCKERDESREADKLTIGKHRDEQIKMLGDGIHAMKQALSIWVTYSKDLPDEKKVEIQMKLI